MKTWLISLFATAIISANLLAQEVLIKFNDVSDAAMVHFVTQYGGDLSLVSEPGQLFKWTTSAPSKHALRDANVIFSQGNLVLEIPKNPSLEQIDEKEFQQLLLAHPEFRDPAYPDNPAIQNPTVQATGADPKLSQAWGMSKIGAIDAFNKYPQGSGIVVAVTDTGVDYNHKDLINSMWRNKGETPGDGIDNDGNGFVDDVVGWDFASNDNKPYDLSMSMVDILFQGGNPGHGTHVAGVVGAQLNNSQGIAGVAPQVKIMAMRFITEKGQGSTENGVKCIDYAVANGAHIINASWGGEKGSEPDQALQEAIKRAEAKGVLFVAAAGNGRASGGAAAGFNNDTDPKPMVPASYNYDNMVAVAANDVNDALAVFSNWGQKSVKVGAPGVKILSTVPGDRYQDTIITLGSMKVTWDGTSMAAPHVAGALAVIWSNDPSLGWKAVRQALFDSTVSLSSLAGKVSTGGRIDLR